MTANGSATKAPNLPRDPRGTRVSICWTSRPLSTCAMSVAAFLLVAAAVTASAQTVETDPLQCWWRTSAGAVRVGEPFTVVLTCAVLETESTKVEVDQSKLEPSVVQFAPFEVLGGSHGVDQRTDLRRFFQYEYRLRLIAENDFGKDVPLPELKISYHVRSDVGQKAAIQGREQSYVLPAQSIRVMSLVPADATDIRDASGETFADVDARRSRAQLLWAVGAVLLTLSALMALLAVVRLFQRFRKPSAATGKLVSDGSALRAAGRALAAVQRDREGGGWTPELAGRAVTPLRIAAAYALGRPVAQTASNGSQPANGNPPADEGALTVNAGWLKRRPISVSGAVTAGAVAREVARGVNSPRRAALLESLDQSIAAFTAAQYGRGEPPGDTTLDDALTAGRNAVRRVAIEQTWLMRKIGPRRPPREVEARAWSR